MSLYHKYRPATFDEFEGNANVVESLRKSLAGDSPPHTIMFHGPTGCGKTTLARICAEELGSRGSDLCEMNVADYRGIDTIRKTVSEMLYRPIESDCRVWILDECHNMVSLAQNAILKALEDTPEHVFFILCTTDPQKLLPTIRSRCARYQVAPLTDREMYKLLKRVVEEEKEELDKRIYQIIVRDSEGHPRAGMQILDQVLAVPPEKREEIASKTLEVHSQTIQLCRELLSESSSWKKVSRILAGLKEENVESVRLSVLNYASAVLLKNQNQRAAIMMECMLDPFDRNGFAGLNFACYQIVCGG